MSYRFLRSCGLAIGETMNGLQSARRTLMEFAEQCEVSFFFCRTIIKNGFVCRREKQARRTFVCDWQKCGGRGGGIY
jgi:hypothetical protein